MLNQKPTPDPEPLDLLDSLERLALSIVGELAAKHHLRREMIYEGDYLSQMVRDIMDVIGRTLPMLDTVEIERLCEGKAIDDDEGANAAWMAKQQKCLKMRNDKAFAMATAQRFVALELGSDDFSAKLVETINRYAAEHQADSQALVNLCMSEYIALRRRLKLPNGGDHE